MVEWFQERFAINKVTPSRFSSETRASQGVILSPNHPNNYNQNLDQSYRIQVTQGKVIEIKFSEFKLDSQLDCGDYIKIEGGDKPLLLPSVCGVEPPSKIMTHFHKLNVFFHSDNFSPNIRDWKTRRWTINWEESMNYNHNIKWSKVLHIYISAAHAMVSVGLEQDDNQAAPLHVKAGERAVLSCNTESEDVKTCEFIDPSGEHWRMIFGIKYEDGRLSYPGDDIKNTCELKINQSQEKDHGVWK